MSHTAVSPRAWLASLPPLQRLVLHGDRWVVEVCLQAQALRARCPAPLAAQARRWRDGLRQPSPPPVRAPLLLICPITVLEDLDLTPALAQLFDRPDLRPHLLCVLPTRAAAELQLRRAREQELHQLLEIVCLADLHILLDRLVPEALLLVLPLFTWLSPAGLSGVAAAVEGAEPEGLLDPASGLALVPADRRRAGLAPTPSPAGSPVLAWSLHSLIEQMASKQGAMAGLDLLAPPPGPTPALNPPAAVAAGARRPLRPLSLGEHGAGLRLPLADSTSPASELIVRDATSEGGGSGTAFCRRLLALLPADGPLRLDPPLLSVAQRPLRAELLLHGSESRVAPISLHVPPHRLEPWMLTAYLNRGGGGNGLIRAFADGLGCTLRYAEDETGYRPGVPVVWGVLRGSDRVLAHARAHGQYFFYCDHAYFDRGHGRSYRITRNGYEAGRVRQCPDDRLAQLDLHPEPWRRGGRSILVCPPTDFFMAAHGCQGWLERTLEELRCHTDRPLVIRQKPRPGEQVPSLHEALADAHALVCHSSNVAIEAVLAGVPVFVAPSSAAAPIGSCDLRTIETPLYPERLPWLAHLAYSQFSVEEIASGEAWRLLLEWEERPFL